MILQVGSDDGHEELLAAANAVINPTAAHHQIWYTHFRNTTLNIRIPKQETATINLVRITSLVHSGSVK
ncbi:hypothetical protein LguiB_018475 [Lonicera macranthoides]